MDNSNNANIVIVGGNFVNKGAQSMLFCLVNHCKQKYPDRQVVLLDLFPSLTTAQKQLYTFGVLNMHVRTLFRLSFPLLKILFKKSQKSDSESDILTAIKNAEVVYDISGYGVSSHNQALVWTLATLLPYRLAAKYNVPVQLLPQSLGPFQYKGWKKMLVWPFVKKWMKYPERIFIREPVSREHLKPIKSSNIIDSFDLVLQSGPIHEELLFTQPPSLTLPRIKPNSVAVIPNRQLFRLWGEPNTVAFFSEVVNAIVHEGKHALILRHSSDDKALCEAVFARTNTSEQVSLCNDDYTPGQMDQLIEQTDALVSARYHGLVHGLKNSIPVLSVGWAVKYEHLMNEFNMGEFHIGHESDNPSALILPKMRQFLSQLPQLKKNIQLRMEEISNQSIYKQYL